MFLLQKIVAPFLFPMPLILGCLTAGVMLLWFSHRPKAGRLLVSLGTLGLFLGSVEPIAHVVVATLKDRISGARGHCIVLRQAVGGADPASVCVVSRPCALAALGR